jgi:hypothetical protein
MATKSKKMSATKSKATAKGRANERSSGRARTPASTKRASQSRYPGETWLTSEDRPADRAGGKQEGGRRPQNRNRQLERNHKSDSPDFKAPSPKRRPVAKNRQKPRKAER